MIAKLKDVTIDTATVSDRVEAEKCESCGKEDDSQIMMNLQDVIFVQTGSANHLLVVELTLKVKSQKMSKIWTSFEHAVSHGCKSVFELEL